MVSSLGWTETDTLMERIVISCYRVAEAKKASARLSKFTNSPKISMKAKDYSDYSFQGD